MRPLSPFLTKTAKVIPYLSKLSKKVSFIEEYQEYLLQELELIGLIVRSDFDAKSRPCSRWEYPKSLELQ